MDLERCVEQALAQLPQEVRSEFSGDPQEVLRADLGLTVTGVEQLAHAREDGGACDGVSFLQDGVILYAPTPNSRRENFTLAHELGHWLVEQVPSIFDWLADQDEPGQLLETLCDRVAQRLLLPEGAVESVIGNGPVRAQHLVDLYNNTQASRPVCAIALARHLPGLGAVAILDLNTATVAHASVKPHPYQGWPAVVPWRGQRLIDSDPLLRLQAGESLSHRLTWRGAWDREVDYYIDAIGDGRRVFAVFSESDLWDIARFHPHIERDFDARPVVTGYCCGRQFERRGYPCPDCRQPYCPQCDHCRCQRAAQREVRCSNCFRQFLPHLVENGLCVECSE